MEPRNRFQGKNSASLCSLAGRNDNPIPTQFLAPIDWLKIPAPVLQQEDFLSLVKFKKKKKISEFLINLE